MKARFIFLLFISFVTQLQFIHSVEESIPEEPQTQLQHYAQDGNLAQVRAVLKRDGAHDATDRGNALVFAAQNHHLFVALALLDRGAYAHVQQALEIAINSGQYELVNGLLPWGAVITRTMVEHAQQLAADGSLKRRAIFIALSHAAHQRGIIQIPG